MPENQTTSSQQGSEEKKVFPMIIIQKGKHDWVIAYDYHWFSVRTSETALPDLEEISSRDFKEVAEHAHSDEIFVQNQKDDKDAGYEDQLQRNVYFTVVSTWQGRKENAEEFLTELLRRAAAQLTV